MTVVIAMVTSVMVMIVCSGGYSGGRDNSGFGSSGGGGYSGSGCGYSGGYSESIGVGRNLSHDNTMDISRSFK